MHSTFDRSPFEVNGLNQYTDWTPSIINYDQDCAGWGSVGHANGAIMQEGTFTGGYNALNQPMLMTSNALAPDWMFFGYDPLGRCVKRWRGALTPEGNVPPPDGNPATYYYYDGWNLIQEGSSWYTANRQYIPRMAERTKVLRLPKPSLST